MSSPKVVDCHTHLMTDNTRGSNRCFPNEPFGQLSLETFANLAMAQGVDLMLLSGVHGTDTAEGLKSVNRRTVLAVNRFPTIFRGLCQINALLPDASLECMEETIVHGPLLGIGEICQYIQGYATDDPGMHPILKRAAELNIPVLMHSSIKEHSDGLGRLADAHPDVQFVMAHMGGMYNWYNGIETAAQHDNIKVDISGPVAMYCGALQWALKRLGPDRMLFGSDFPLIYPAPMLRSLDVLELNDRDYAKIASQNCIDLFKLTGGLVE